MYHIGVVMSIEHCAELGFQLYVCVYIYIYVYIRTATRCVSPTEARVKISRTIQRVQYADQGARLKVRAIRTLHALNGVWQCTADRTPCFLRLLLATSWTITSHRWPRKGRLYFDSCIEASSAAAAGAISGSFGLGGTARLGTAAVRERAGGGARREETVSGTVRGVTTWAGVAGRGDAGTAAKSKLVPTVGTGS